MKIVSAIAFVALVVSIGPGAFVARAEPVTRAEAEYAARRWAVSGAALGARLGERVISSETLEAGPDAVIHAVRLEGGVAFVSGDTELEPVVAFTSDSGFEPSDDNPLWALLRRDAAVRAGALAKKPAKRLLAAAAPGAPTAARGDPGAASRWAKLLEGRPRAGAKRLAASSDPAPAPTNRLAGVSDVRRAPLVATRWSQRSAKGRPCYNLFTPNRYPCGCCATAMAQLMKFHEHPKSATEARTFGCEVDDESTNLVMRGGVYDWARMPLRPDESAYDEAGWAAIGAITYDAGVALESSYGDAGTASFVPRIAARLRDVFGYANARALFDWEIALEADEGDGRVHSSRGLHSKPIREKIVYANLDAGYPVAFGFYGYVDMKIGDFDSWCGHAIVADGYGFSDYAGEPVAYVHLNMGWAGADDAWYNLPEAHTAETGAVEDDDGVAFTVLSAAVYNIFPDRTGDIIAGRVTDDAGRPLAGATMTISPAGGGTPLRSMRTDGNGVYAFVVPGDAAYDVACDFHEVHEVHAGLFLPGDVMEADDFYGVYTELDGNVGNLWGHDADFALPLSTLEAAHGEPLRVADRLHAVDFTAYHYAASAVDFGRRFADRPSPSGSMLRVGRFLGRTLDGTDDGEESFVISVCADPAAGRRASIGLARCAMPRDGKDWEALPFFTTDGVNDAGVAIGVTAVPDGTSGTRPGAEPLAAIAATRFALDRATNAAHAAELIRSRDVFTTGPGGFHWLVSDPSLDTALEIDGDAIVAATNRIMTDFSLSRFVETDGATSGHVPHARGVERWERLRAVSNTVTDAATMMDALSGVRGSLVAVDPGSVTNRWSDFNGREVDVDGDGEADLVLAQDDSRDPGSAVFRAREALAADVRAGWLLASARYACIGERRGLDPITPSLGVHASVYDLEAKTLLVRSEERPVDFAFDLAGAWRSRVAAVYVNGDDAGLAVDGGALERGWTYDPERRELSLDGAGCYALEGLAGSGVTLRGNVGNAFPALPVDAVAWAFRNGYPAGTFADAKTPLFSAALRRRGLLDDECAERGWPRVVAVEPDDGGVKVRLELPGNPEMEGLLDPVTREPVEWSLRSLDPAALAGALGFRGAVSLTDEFSCEALSVKSMNVLSNAVEFTLSPADSGVGRLFLRAFAR